MKKVDILVISISNPILLGIYFENKLLNTIELEGKTSDTLPSIFQKLVKEYSFGTLLYVNGPGSYMAIKIAYIFLKTFAITKDIPLKSASGFEFNNNTPIKALGKKYFFNTCDDNIEVKFLSEDDKLCQFKLPSELDITLFSDDSLPNYQLPAV